MYFDGVYIVIYFSFSNILGLLYFYRIDVFEDYIYGVGFKNGIFRV